MSHFSGSSDGSSVVIGIRLPYREARLLAKLAEALGTSKSELLRPAVRERLVEIRGLLEDRVSV